MVWKNYQHLYEIGIKIHPVNEEQNWYFLLNLLRCENFDPCFFFSLRSHNFWIALENWFLDISVKVQLGISNRKIGKLLHFLPLVMGLILGPNLRGEAALILCIKRNNGRCISVIISFLSQRLWRFTTSTNRKSFNCLNINEIVYTFIC